jgi:hypothetical protein
MSEALLPCPFCGQPPRMQINRAGAMHLFCANFDCIVSPEIESLTTGDDKETAAAWNTRADSDLRASHARLVEAMEIARLHLADYSRRTMFGTECDQDVVQAQTALRAALAAAPRT